MLEKMMVSTLSDLPIDVSVFSTLNLVTRSFGFMQYPTATVCGCIKVTPHVV